MSDARSIDGDGLGIDRDLRDTVTASFVDAGLTAAMADKFAAELAGVIMRIAQEHCADQWISILLRLRPTLFGTCLFRVLTSDDTESVKAIARRVCASPKAVRKAEARIRELLGLVPPDDRVTNRI